MKTSNCSAFIWKEGGTTRTNGGVSVGYSGVKDMLEKLQYQFHWAGYYEDVQMLTGVTYVQNM